MFVDDVYERNLSGSEDEFLVESESDEDFDSGGNVCELDCVL